MTGLSESDLDQIKEYAETPAYARSPEMLTDDADDNADETRSVDD
jgi:hypothetical protein